MKTIEEEVAEFEKQFSPGRLGWSTPLSLRHELGEYIRTALTRRECAVREETILECQSALAARHKQASEHFKLPELYHVDDYPYPAGFLTGMNEAAAALPKLPTTAPTTGSLTPPPEGEEVTKKE